MRESSASDDPTKTMPSTAGERCDRCNGSGVIGVSNGRFTYIGPGPVPDDARGVCEIKCDECRGRGFVADEHTT